MNQTESKVRSYLIELARDKRNQTISYQKLSEECHLKLEMSNPNHREKMEEILDSVSTYEHNANARPLLSALVVLANPRGESLNHGDGFYKLAAELRKSNWNTLKKDLFGIEEIKNCIDFWNNEIKYQQFKEVIY